MEGSYVFQLTNLVTHVAFIFVATVSSSTEHQSRWCHRSLGPPYRLLREEQDDVPQSLRRYLSEAHLSLSNPSSVDNLH